MFNRHANHQTRSTFRAQDVASRLSYRIGPRRLGKEVVCAALILNLLLFPISDRLVTRPVSLGLATIPATVDAVWAGARNIYSRTHLVIEPFAPFIIPLWLGSASQEPEELTIAQRTIRVASIEVNPSKYVGYLDETVTFTALGLDSLGEVVHGAKFTWQSSDSDKLRIDEAGRATSAQAGRVTITCSTGFTQARATVLIRGKRRPLQTDQEWKNDQSSAESSSTGGLDFEKVLPGLVDRLFPTVHAQGGSGVDIPESAAVGAVGSPPHAIQEPSRLGPIKPRSNFNLGIPIVNLGGRGLATSLTLYYNSDPWGARTDPVQGPMMTFDPIQSWPSPGFTLGLGRMVDYSLSNDPSLTRRFMWVDPDGTRHDLGLGQASGTNTLRAMDGSNIVYVGNATTGGTLYLLDGTKLTIARINNRLLVTQITETNGNYVQCAYKSSSQGFAPVAINYITDTPGRVIQFNYGGTSLASITTPLGTASFTYQNVILNTNFLNVTVENAPSSFYGVSTVTVPNRPTYNLTYSGYGLIYNIAFSGGGANGSVTYNYPLGGEFLYFPPTFSQRTESPSSTFTYTNESGIEVVTRPDGSKLRITGSSWEIRNSAGASLAKVEYTSGSDPGGAQQVASITTYDDTSTPVKVTMDYDQYGNVTNKREYGFKINGTWQVRRRTRYTYLDYQRYIDAYMRNLVSRVEVFDALQNTTDADDVLVGKTEFQYDNYWWNEGIEGYSGAAPPGHLSSYGTAYTLRGNATAVTKWSDLSGAGTTSNSKYDKFGNVVRAQVNCCSEKQYTLGENTYWSQAEQVISDPGGINLTESTAYNFNNGSVANQTDPNNQTTSFTYDGAGRPTGYTLPTGASGSTACNIWGLSTSSSFTYSDGGVNKTLVRSAVYDGWGQVIQTVDANGAQVNIGYDSMGRVQSRTNPFPEGGTPGLVTTYQYDVLGRQTVITLPGGNTIQYSFSGSTTITDQVNRKIRYEGDGLGRMTKAVEQDASGGLTQETSYVYDIADRLIQVNQGGQIRSFKYDAEGRLLFERIPEQTATINDGMGVFWSMKYTYTTFGAVATRTDGRGVVTTYGYDALNRPASVTYNTVSGVATAPPVTYTYDNDPTYGTVANGKLVRVNVGSDYQERYTFDAYKRPSTLLRTLGALTYTTSYQYNQMSQLTYIGYPSGRGLNIGRDSRAKLSTISLASTGANYLSNVGYNVAGQVTGSTLGNGVTDVFAYDTNRGQITSHTAGTVSPFNNLMNLSSSFQASAGQMGAGSTAGNAGQLMSVSGSLGGSSESAGYTYDLLGRTVTSSQTSNGASAQRRFVYDRWGNRTSVWDAVSGGNLIQSIALQQPGGIPTNQIASVTTVGTVNYAYDAAGNLTSDGTHTYSYDSDNRLVSVDGGATAQYSYDHTNRRWKKVAGVVTVYVWEQLQVLAEHDGSTGASLVDYVHAGRRLVARIATGATMYFLADPLSVRVMLDSGGTVVGRQGHLPFGEGFGQSGTQDKHVFASYERDSESATDYAVNRQYQHNVGRFNRPDPLAASADNAAPQTWNRYAYVANDVINKEDPSGLFKCTGCSPPLAPWELNPCRRFGATYLLDGMDMYAGFFCGGAIPSPLGIIGALLVPLAPGILIADKACQEVYYVPEKNTSSDSEAAWKSVAGVQKRVIPADFVGTPRGVIKIPGTCVCAVSCTGGADYRVSCTCPPPTIPIEALSPVPRTVAKEEYGRTVPAPPGRYGVGRRDHYREPPRVSAGFGDTIDYIFE